VDQNPLFRAKLVAMLDRVGKRFPQGHPYPVGRFLVYVGGTAQLRQYTLGELDVLVGRKQLESGLLGHAREV